MSWERAAAGRSNGCSSKRPAASPASELTPGRRCPAAALQLEAISARLLGSEAAPAPAGPLQASLCGGPLLVPLVRLLADPVERCRELAAGFLGAAVARMTDVAGLLPTLVPALAERMGALPVEELSEEIRLLLAQLAGRIVERHAAAQLAPQASSGGADLLGGVVQVLCRGLEDGFPDIKKVRPGPPVRCMLRGKGVVGP